MPAAVYFRGDYAIFPELKGRVTVLNNSGKIVAQVGNNPDETQRANFGLAPEKWKEGVCNSPHGASMDKQGNLIVSEWANSAICKIQANEINFCFSFVVSCDAGKERV